MFFKPLFILKSLQKICSTPKLNFFQSDGGGEFVNSSFKHLFSQHGIHHRLSCPHHPEQNGLAERKHRHLVEIGLTLLAHASVPHTFWDDAFHTANYLINRLPTKILNGVSPFQKLFSKSPQYDFLKVFGYACFPYLRPYTDTKLKFRSKQCIFLGYSLNYQGYKCYDPTTGKSFLSRHVIFNEKSFPYTDLATPTLSKPSQLDHVLPIDTFQYTPPYSTPRTPPSLVVTSPSPLHPTPSLSHSLLLPTPASHTILPSSTPDSHSHPPTPTTHVNIEPANTTSHTVPSTHPMITRGQQGIRKPNPRYACITTVTNTLVEPTCFSQANKSPQWRQAMADEFNALQRTGTWTLVPYKSSMNVLPNKWVYRIKKNSDGSIERFKARLVANGFHQQEGIDFCETFSPVVTHATIRLILSIALHFQWPIRQLDVQNAFLHGTLNEEVYMRQPAGFIDPQFPSHVCRLRRSLYGLKQAPRAWFQCFSQKLEELGFTASQADSSLFTYFDGSTILYLLIYVDDILITGNTNAHLSQFITQLGTHFAMKDLGPLHYFLGMEVSRTPSAFYLTQSKYILELLQNTNMADAKPISTPVPSGKRLSLYDGEPLSDGSSFRSVVGALQYLLFTRPDIAYAVNQVCQYMHSPTTAHWAAVKRILRYLKGTHDHGLIYKPSPLTLTAFADADYAGDPDNRRSTGGHCIFLGDNLISWSLKKQRDVLRSSTEAEYRQLTYTSAHLSWFRNIFCDLHLP